MKKIIKDNMKFIIQTIFIIVVTSIISVSATNLSSRDVIYTDGEAVASVEEALNTLYNSVEVTTLTPVGAVLSYMGVNAPTNYLICDGTVYNIADYQKLANHIKDNFGSYNYFGGNGTTTFAVPDLRGEFLRGAGTNSHANQGSGANVGVHQDATEHMNIGTGSNYTFIYSGVQANGMTSDYTTKDSIIGSDTGSWTNRTGNNSYGGATRASKFTSRPTNTSVNYIIKAK